MAARLAGWLLDDSSRRRSGKVGEEDEVGGQTGKVGEGSAQGEGEEVSDTVRLGLANGGPATKDKFACKCAVLTFTGATSEFVVLTFTAGTLNSDALTCAVF